jgi:hypothetical protein
LRYLDLSFTPIHDCDFAAAALTASLHERLEQLLLCGCKHINFETPSLLLQQWLGLEFLDLSATSVQVSGLQV